MSMKKLGLLTGMAAMFGMMSNENSDSKTVRKRLTNQAPRKPEGQLLVERNQRRGLKEFNIEGHIIWAINEKNAKRKILNNLLKQHS